MFQTLENLEDQLEDLEMDILVYAAKEKFNRIIELKAQVNLLKKICSASDLSGRRLSYERK